MGSPNLWLVVPVHGREAITRLCLEQKVHLAAELAASGIRLDVVVVGNDANLNTARELGFHTMERPNNLGAKLNDAFEWICTDTGADFISFVGSDDWMLPSFMASLPAPDRVRTSKWIAFVSPRGDELIVSDIQGAPGSAPWIVPTGLLERCGYRPFHERKGRGGMDGSLARSIAPVPLPRPSNSAERRERWKDYTKARHRLYDDRPADELRAVDFKGNREQMTKWGFVRGRRSRIRYEESDVWGLLATRYPLHLVERMKDTYESGQA